MNSQIFNSTEIIDIEKCQQFLKLNNSTIIKSFNMNGSDRNEDGKCYASDNATYIAEIKKWCVATIDNNGINQTHYKQSKTSPEGRMYINGFGIQRLSREIRSWFCHRNYYDFDMKNCHPVILYNYMKNNHPETKLPILQKYIEDRDTFLKKSKLNKLQVLIMLNSDKYSIHNDTNPDILKIQTALFKNFNTCRKVICQGNTLDENAKNPMSSYTNKLMCKLENKILCEVAKEMDIPMYDGFMIRKSKVDNITDSLNQLNNFDICKLYNITWTQKIISDSIKIINVDESEEPIFNSKDKSYEAVKYEMEKTNFLIKAPMMFINEFKNHKNESVLNMMDCGGFRNLTAPFKYEVKVTNSSGEIVNTKQKPIYPKWIEDSQRRSYDQLIFYPKLNCNVNNSYNLFKGFKCNKHDDYENNIDGLNRFLELVKCLCGNDNESIEYLLNWAAHLIQKPEELPLVAVLIKSMEGCGKDTFREYLEKIIGSDYVYTTDKIDNIIGNFNPNISNKLLIQLNEAKSFDGHSSVAALKHLITTSTVEINQKNVKSYKLDNYARLLLFSNETNVVQITAEDRRYVVIKSGNKLDQEFYTGLYDDLKNKDIVKSVYHFLSNRDISQFKFTDRPKNKAYADMVQSNTNPIYEFIYNKTNESDTDTIKIKQAQLFYEYQDFLVNNGIKIDVNPKSVKSLLCDLGLENKVFKIGGKSSRGFVWHKDKILNELKSKYTPVEIEEIEEIEFISDIDELDGGYCS